MLFHLLSILGVSYKLGILYLCIRMLLLFIVPRLAFLTAAVHRQLNSGASAWTMIYHGHAVCGSLISHSRSLLCAGLPIFTGPIYGWSGSETGLLLAVLGIASIPLSFLVGYMSPHISDRSLTAAALLATLLGATLCTRAGNAHDPAAYFGGGAILYMVRNTLSLTTVLMS